MVKFYDTRIGRYVRKFNNWRLFSSLRLGDIAIDCGANVGKFTKKMARPGVEVYAFEPDPNAFKELQKNMQGYNGVVLINKAVSNHNGRAKIYFNDRYNEDPKKWSVGSTLLEEKPHVDRNNFAEVELVDLSEFITSLGKPVSLLKMDIEGEEIKVLNKLIDKKLTSTIKYILVETHERFPTLNESTQELRKRIKLMGIKNINLDWA